MSTIFTGSFILVAIIILVVLLGAVAGIIVWMNSSNNKVLTDALSEPLNGLSAAKFDIYTDSGNLAIDQLAGGGQELVNGAVQYTEKGGLPNRALTSKDGQATFTLKGGDGGRPWLHFPWEACNSAIEWQLHLNPSVAANITAKSGGGNVKLDLTGMTLTGLSTETGGGNVVVTLPENAASLNVTAKSGGGNVTVAIGRGSTGSSLLNAQSGAGSVTVQVPEGLAAKIQAKTGMGKVMVDPRFSKLDASTYQSPDYDTAPNRVEITLGSGAGNVVVETN